MPNSTFQKFLSYTVIWDTKIPEYYEKIEEEGWYSWGKHKEIRCGIPFYWVHGSNPAPASTSRQRIVSSSVRSTRMKFSVHNSSKREARDNWYGVPECVGGDYKGENRCFEGGKERSIQPCPEKERDSHIAFLLDGRLSCACHTGSLSEMRM